MRKFGWAAFILGCISVVTFSVSSWILQSILKVITPTSLFPLIIDALTAFLGWNLVRGNRNKLLFGFTIFIFIIWCLIFIFNFISFIGVISSR